MYVVALILINELPVFITSASRSRTRDPNELATLAAVHEVHSCENVHTFTLLIQTRRHQGGRSQERCKLDNRYHEEDIQVKLEY